MPASVSVTDPAGHAMQAATDTGLYNPAAHGVHVVAAGSPSVLVTEPEAHNAHAAVALALYCPAAHTVQAMAPVLDSVSVTDPAPQASHEVWPAASWNWPAAHGAHAASEDVLYCPATHAVQLTAPVLLKASVVEPAPQTKHAICPALPWYWPAAHATHATVDDALLCPAMHAVHIVAPLLAKVFVVDPASHVLHATVDAGLYWPAAHAVHAVLPARTRVSVTDPAEHATHGVVDWLLYCPASHAVHVEYLPTWPGLVPTTEPASHWIQSS